MQGPRFSPHHFKNANDAVSNLKCAVCSRWSIVHSLFLKKQRRILPVFRNFMIQQRWCYSIGKPGEWHHCWALIVCIYLKGSISGMESCRWFRMLAVLTVDLTSVPSLHLRELSATCNPSSRGSDTPVCPQWTLCSCVYITHMHTHPCK